MTELTYLTDSYLKELKSRVVSVVKKGGLWEIILEKTIFYPQGGGQPSDKGMIIGRDGKTHVKHVRMQNSDAIHECSIVGNLKAGDSVDCQIDWQLRFYNMRVHSAGHIVHEAVMAVTSGLEPVKADHGNHPFIEYRGSIPIDKKYLIEQKANDVVKNNVRLTTEFVTLDELKKRSSFVPAHLPKNKPLRILTVEGFQPIPDGGTQVKSTGEVGSISVSEIVNEADIVRVYYSVANQEKVETSEETIATPNFIGMLLEAQSNAKALIDSSDLPIDKLRLEILGPKSELAKLTKLIRNVASADRQQAGTVLNEVKESLEKAISSKLSAISYQLSAEEWFDVTVPGLKPPIGHLHIVTQAIMEITRIFERLGFTRVRHPEVDWDWYAFESLNMPKNHPARDEWETFFIERPHKNSNSERSEESSSATQNASLDPSSKQRVWTQDDIKHGQIVLTPHTSNGQVREMEKGKLPVRMINIAKCYRRQSDISHTPMFHQFEGMYIDKNVSIMHLKGVFDYFVKQFFGPTRRIRLRPFHFQFTEPSFELDISCGICLGTGKLADGKPCKLCKSGWLELGGSGMIHPNVLRFGGIDPDKYSGFAFGWGVERTYMMKSDSQIDDIRLIYSNDVKFLEQF